MQFLEGDMTSRIVGVAPGSVAAELMVVDDQLVAGRVRIARQMCPPRFDAVGGDIKIIRALGTLCVECLAICAEQCNHQQQKGVELPTGMPLSREPGRTLQ